MTLAYQDILIHTELERLKKANVVTTKMLVERFFTDFVEMDSRLMTADPFRFPGFRGSIEEAIAKGIPPCGAITGIARLKSGGAPRHVGVVLSNLEFQAGAFDMAACEKFCKLLVNARDANYPSLLSFRRAECRPRKGRAPCSPWRFSTIASRDLSARPAAGALLRIWRLHRWCAGQFRDASAGTDLLFLRMQHAVRGSDCRHGTSPIHRDAFKLPEPRAGSHAGMVKHPFHENLDEVLRAIDPMVPVPKETVQEVIERVLRLELEVAENRGSCRVKQFRVHERWPIHASAGARSRMCC